MTVAGLARAVGTSRQTIHAIEGGSFVPNTALSLELARCLDVRVEDMFVLERPAEERGLLTPEAFVGNAGVAAGTPVRVCNVGSRMIAFPVPALGAFLPSADGMIGKLHSRSRGDVRLLAPWKEREKQIVVAGCDPALGLIAEEAHRKAGLDVVLVPASSRQALRWLKQDHVHVAGSHLYDAPGDEFNLPYLRKHLPSEDLTVVTFAHWAEGFVVAPGNPLEIRCPEDLGRASVRIVNREQGAGSRDLLDRLLKQNGLKPVNVSGYDDVAKGHLEAAYAVSTGRSDCCVATASAAAAFGLSFVPLQQERFDFVLRRSSLSHPGVQVMLELLQAGTLRRRLEIQAGCDTQHTGRTVA
jgi:putative molybdopterin biosynthesis protein